MSDTVKPSVFHRGEQALQLMLGDAVHARLEQMGHAIMRDYMPDQHREFFALLPFVSISAIGDDEHPVAFMRTGAPGFAHSPVPDELHIISSPLAGEPEDLKLSPGDKVSIVGIQLETRRRNRMNGTIQRHDGEKMVVKVDMSFGNCPQYIQTRAVTLNKTEGVAGNTVVGSTLNDKMKGVVAKADSLFIASRSKELTDDRREGLDINHRGGKPGFVEILDDETITFIDYRGNNFFNTLGNIVLDPRVGVIIPDYSDGSLLNIKGEARILVNPKAEPEGPKTQRRVEIKLQEAQLTPNALPLSFEFGEYSPLLG